MTLRSLAGMLAVCLLVTFGFQYSTFADTGPPGDMIVQAEVNTSALVVIVVDNIDIVGTRVLGSEVTPVTIVVENTFLAATAAANRALVSDLSLNTDALMRAPPDGTMMKTNADPMESIRSTTLGHRLSAARLDAATTDQTDYVRLITNAASATGFYIRV